MHLTQNDFGMHSKGSAWVNTLNAGWTIAGREVGGRKVHSSERRLMCIFHGRENHSNTPEDRVELEGCVLIADF